ncbi:N-acetylmuramoyl-L-alanine amidase [Dokdonia genika]|uniref:N-acetylmuramoyl-L-alanine amidase n=1 Tax=Dokdonia genika TaxID=308113 RepID=A0ABV9L7Z9_9FLAO
MFLLLQFCVVFAQGERIKKRIVIDPGHGGFDSGAVGINGVLEKDIVLSIAEEIIALNNKSGEPLEIYLTRYSDTLISLSNRTRLARTLKADLFLSLHCNHSDNPNARGVEVYVSIKKSKYAVDATWVAYELQRVFKRELGFESRGVKFGDFLVLRESADYCPIVLLELGFLSNENEVAFYSIEENKLSVAISIFGFFRK